MELAAIIELGLKGLGLAQTLWEAGNSDGAKIAYKSIADLFAKAERGEPTDADFKAIEDVLDAQLRELNEPLPPE